VTLWEANHAYQQEKLIADNIHVVNESAESQVKLCLNFSGSAHKENNLQCILQAIENPDHFLPNQKRKNLESSSWCLAVR